MREPWERYLNDVVSHVRFAFDRRKIRQELAEHMEDLYEDLLSQDIDEEQALAARYGVQSIPTVIVFKNGQILATLVGVRPYDAYTAEIDKAL